MTKRKRSFSTLFAGFVLMCGIFVACGGADSNETDSKVDTWDPSNDTTGGDVSGRDTEVSGDVGRDANGPGDAIADGGQDAGETDDSMDVNPDSDSGDAKQVSLSYDFTQILPTDALEPSKEGWEAGISDYSTVQEDTLAFESDVKKTPMYGEGESGQMVRVSPLDHGFFLKSRNVSDDSFMFLKRQIGGNAESSRIDLKSNQTYQLRYKITFLSNAASNCVGIGGPPGEAVYLKAGGSTVEPVAELNEEDDYRMNIDKGNQSSGGENAGVTGNIANGVECEESDGEYVEVERTYTHENAIQTDESGQMWLIVGTDSGFEGATAIYYAELEVTLIPMDIIRN